MSSPLLIMGTEVTKKAKKPRKPKTGETGEGHTQVGEAATGHEPAVMSPPPPPTHRKMEKEAAVSEKLHATRRWVAGEITSKQHAEIHRRANVVMRGRHVRGKK